MRKTFFAILVLLSFKSVALEIQHSLGTTQLTETPKRIIALEFSFVDALAASGVTPIGIADDKKRERIREEYTDIIGQEWKSVGTRKAPSIEVMSSLKPDLIIADEKRHSAIYPVLSQIAPTIVLNSLGGDYSDSITNLQTIAKAVRKEKEVTERISQHRLKIKNIADQLKTAGRYSIQFGVADADNLWLHTPDSYNTNLLSVLGFKTSMKDEGDMPIYVSSSLEQFSEINPDILLIGEYANPSVIHNWSDIKLFRAVSAIKNKRIYRVDTHQWTRVRGIISAELKAEEVLKMMNSMKE